jgi:hypothetical protein
MPRARISDATEEVVLPKPRVRKPRAVSVDGENPAPRKRAAPRTRSVAAAAVTPAATTRKAPTQLSYQRQTRSKKTKSMLVVIAVGLVLTAAGVGIGFIDKGPIDVVAVVNERNEKINKGEVRDEAGNPITQTIQVQTDARPNGGLPMGDAVAPPPTPAVSSTTDATTTPEVASSTEVVDTEATTTPESL